MSRLRVGIAGYGVVGKRRHQCVNRNPNLKLVAVCDRSLDGAGNFDDGVNYFSHYKDLLADNLDVLIVCMTNEIAAEVTIAGLQKGLHVFCEKPPGRNLDDIRRVLDVESSHPNQKLMYGFNHRYHESVIDALEIVRSGKLGKVINLRGVYGKSKVVSFNQNDWRSKREIAGGGILLDQGIHMVDLMRLFAGEFTEVHSFVTNSYWKYDIEDNAYAIMRTEDGIIGMLNSSATQWRHRFNLDINFERGSVILGGLLTGTKSYGAETLLIAECDHETDSGDPKETLIRYNNDPSWQSEIDEFTSSIVQNVELKNGTSTEALETMRLVYKIYFADSQWRERFNIEDPGVTA